MDRGKTQRATVADKSEHRRGFRGHAGISPVASVYAGAVNWRASFGTNLTQTAGPVL